MCTVVTLPPPVLRFRYRRTGLSTKLVYKGKARNIDVALSGNLVGSQT